MDSDWLDPAEIVKMLDEASAGSPQPLSAWLRESRLRCSSPDYSSVVLVRDHKVSRLDRLRWEDLNVPPGADDPRMQFINLLWRTETGGATWSKVPVPRARRIVEACSLHGRYSFLIANDLRMADRLPEFLHEKFVGCAKPGSELTDATVADNFARIFDAGRVPGPPPIDLEAVPAELPRAIEDSVLGLLTREDDGYGRSFRTTIVALGRRVNVTVGVDWKGSCARELWRATAIVGRLDDYVAKAKSHAASMFLDLKNNNWLAEDEQPVSSDEFQELMQLSGLRFDTTGGVEFVFADGESADRSGLFWGHWIVVNMRGNQFTRVDIEG